MAPVFPFFMFAGLFSKKKEETKVPEVQTYPDRFFALDQSETERLMKDHENGDPHISFRVYKNLQYYRKLVANYNEKYQMSVVISPNEMKLFKKERDDDLEVLREYSRQIIAHLREEAFTGFYWKK